MKKLLLIVGIAITQFSFSQNTRFVYQVSMKTDSTKADTKTELAYLDVSPSKSIFYSENRVKRDSIIAKARQTGSFNFDRSQMQNLRSNINYVVEKDLVNQSLLYKDRVGRDNYSYTEKPNFSWKILPETVKIGDYKAQKAQTNYAGRTWYAWFTTDLPYQDGPYKFSGLPGLIIKAQDKSGDFSFDLMQTKKIQDMQTLSERGQTVSLSKEKFNEIQKKFVADPLTYMNANRGNQGGGNPGGGNFGGGGNRGGGNGGGNRPQMSPQDQKDMQQRMLNEIKSNNNTLEKIK